jgi:hypothetical protein
MQWRDLPSEPNKWTDAQKQMQRGPQVYKTNPLPVFDKPPNLLARRTEKTAAYSI